MVLYDCKQAKERGDKMAMSLKAARVNAGMTQRQVVAEYNRLYGTKLSVTTLLNWERNNTFPTVLQFKALCDMYGVTMNDIIVPTMQP